MPFPLIPIVSALAAGGSLVPHAAGGLIVTSAGGYVAGTYLSTSAVAGLIATASTTLGLGALSLSAATAKIIGSAGLFGTTIGASGIKGAVMSIVGSSGIFGTTIGASGIKGALMSLGIISATPVWVPIAVGAAALGCVYGSYLLLKLRKKIKATPAGQEAQFTDIEAKIIENLVKRLGMKENPEEKA